MARVVLLFLVLLLSLAAIQTTCAPAPGDERTATSVATGLPTSTILGSPEATPAPTASPSLALQLISDAFEHSGEIPSRHALCPDRINLSPPLTWSRVPAGTESLALICVDTDVDFVHWVIFNIPPSATGLPEGLEGIGTLEGGMVQGTNDYGELGYGGPCPPSGQTHTYIFTLYALDTALDLPAGASAFSLRQAMEGHILSQAEFAGSYAAG